MEAPDKCFQKGEILASSIETILVIVSITKVKSWLLLALIITLPEANLKSLEFIFLAEEIARQHNIE